MPCLVCAAICAHIQVLFYGQAGKDATTFRNHGHAFVHNFVRFVFGQVFTFQSNAALARFQQSADRAQGGGFAGAIGANQGDDFTLFYGQGDAFQRVDVSVIGVDIVELLAYAIVTLSLFYAATAAWSVSKPAAAPRPR